MGNDIRIDSHKLMLHPKRVSDWLEGTQIYPIEMEVGLCGSCNHRCIFCAVDYMDYKPIMLNADVFKKCIREMADKGLKSLIFAGEGEPLLHRDAAGIVNFCKNQGVDCAISTNGVFLTRSFVDSALSDLTWIRFSIAGASELTYRSIHNARPGDLDIVLKNMKYAVEAKQEKKLPVTLGAQLLLLPENEDEVVDLAYLMRDIGLDYFTVKPFSQHPLSKVKRNVDYSKSEAIERKLETIKTDSFQIFFRKNAIDNVTYEKVYGSCRGLPFMLNMDAKGNVYPCMAHFGREECNYGNIYEADFDDIWKSTKAMEIMNRFHGSTLQNECREACRLDEINKYLEELKSPNTHVNFI